MLVWVQQVCAYVYSMCISRNTYALHGFPGSDHNYAECEALWTRLMWHYLAPEMHTQNTQQYILAPHTLNLIGTVSAVFFSAPELIHNQCD